MSAAPSTHEQLRLEVLAALREGTDAGQLTFDRAQVVATVREKVADYQQRAEQGLERPLSAPETTIERLLRSILEAGPLTKYFDNPTYSTEVGISRDTITAATPNGGLEIDPEPTCEAELLAIVERLLADAGAVVNHEHPVVVHQIWNNQVRASVSIPPVSDHLDATFRIYRPQRMTLAELVKLGSLSEPAANFLAATMLARTGHIVSGEPGAGKTTVAGSLLWAAPATTNTRIIQEARELEAAHLPGGRWSPEAGGHSIRSLVNRALQFAPDLLVVGETRGAEAFELLKAANAGCGFVSTLHAKSARMAMESLVTAALMAGENVPERQVRRSFAALIDVVIHCAAEPLHLVEAGRPRLRQVVEIATIPAQLTDDQFVLEPVFKRERLGAPMEYCGSGSLGELAADLDHVLPAGITIEGLCTGQERLP